MLLLLLLAVLLLLALLLLLLPVRSLAIGLVLVSVETWGMFPLTLTVLSRDGSTPIIVPIKDC